MPFVGRTGELARLGALLEQVPTAGSATVFVGGEAGMGKTRLVDELSGRARLLGFRVAVGGATPLEGRGLPYGVMVSALRDLEHQLPTDLANSVLGPAFGALGLPLAGGAPAESPPRPVPGTMAKVWLLEVILRSLAVLSEATPTLLVLEDLQWSDAASLGVVDFVTRGAGSSKLIVVCTYRIDEVRTGDPLENAVVELGRLPQVSTILLGGLDELDLVAFVSAILGRRPERTLVDALRSRSAGNPFFVEELVAAGAVGAWSPTLTGAVASRLAGLSSQAATVLGAASALGVEARHALLLEATGLGELEFDTAVRECIGRQVVVPSDRGTGYRFRHELVREAVYGSLLPGERIRVHRRIAEALRSYAPTAPAGQGVPEAELAAHWWAAGLWNEALCSALAAADSALEVFAFEEAIAHLEHALDAYDQLGPEAASSMVDRATLVERAADAAYLAGAGERSIELARTALVVLDGEADPLRRAMAYVRLARNQWALADPPASFEALAAAEALIPTDEPTIELARTLSEKARCLMLMSRFREGELVCRRAISVAKAAGARREEGHALNTLGVCLSYLGLRDEGIEMLRDALRTAEDLRSPEDISRGYSNLSSLLYTAGRLEEAVELVRSSASSDEDLGGIRFQGAALNAAEALVDLGRWDEAEATVALVGSLMGNCGNHPGMVRSMLALRRGNLEEAAHEIAIIDRNTEQLDDVQFRGTVLVRLAELALLEGRPWEGYEAVERALALAASTDDSDVIPEMCAKGAQALADTLEQARVAGRRHDPVKLQLLAGELAEHAGEVVARSGGESATGAPRAQAMVALCIAEATRLDRSDPSAWESAERQWRQLGQPFETAYCQWRHADALLATRSRRAQARDLLRDAWRTAVGLGARPLVSRVEALAQRAGIALEPGTEDQRRLTRMASDLGITAREAEVLAQLAAGRTDGQISAALFISKKTVSVHVSSLLRKLDAGSRYEAGEIGRRAGLDPFA